MSQIVVVTEKRYDSLFYLRFGLRACPDYGFKAKSGKYYTKEKVSGELLTNAEQRTSMRAGGGVARHTHTHTQIDQRGSAACQYSLLNLPSASNIT